MIDYRVILDIEMNKLIATLYHYKFVDNRGGREDKGSNTEGMVIGIKLCFKRVSINTWTSFSLMM